MVHQKANPQLKLFSLSSNPEIAEKIAKDLNYSFLDGELTELFLLHKTTNKRVVKKRIEDLLTYCNFHYESGALHNGYYELVL